MANLLLIIDIQNDYFPGGKMELVGSIDAGRKAFELQAFFRERNWPIIQMQHVALRPDAAFFLPLTQGVQIHDCVKPLDKEMVMQKNFTNSFRETELHFELQRQGIRHLVIAGMMTHACVDTAVRAAFDFGYRTSIAHDACATRDLTWNGRTVGAADVHASYMGALHGRFGTVASSQEIIAELIKHA